MNAADLKSLIGRRARFSLSLSNGDIATYSAAIVKVGPKDKPGTVWIEIPARVRMLPFPPIGGKRYGLFLATNLKLK